jgi:hypothetical protein
LHFTAAQQARAFLAAVNAPFAPTSSSQEVIAGLISRVRASRDEPQARALLGRLVAELAGVDRRRLPTPPCETRDAAALADELSWLLADRAEIARAGRPRRTMTLLAAAALLGGLAAGIGCGDDDKRQDEIDCVVDTTTSHFDGIIEGADGLTSEEIAAVEDDYEGLGPDQREEVMKALCGLSADQVADYIRNGYAGDAHPPESDDDDTDAAPAYKGVTF